jgi:hypothetical protein
MPNYNPARSDKQAKPGRVAAGVAAHGRIAYAEAG